jgi:hypothetical protein
MQQADDANAAFANALSIHDNLSKGWTQWAQFCEQQLSTVPAAKRSLWAGYAMECYLQGIRSGVGAERRRGIDKYVSRIMWLLLQEDESDTLAGMMKKIPELHVPGWLWLPVIPVLLRGTTPPHSLTEVCACSLLCCSVVVSDMSSTGASEGVRDASQARLCLLPAVRVLCPARARRQPPQRHHRREQHSAVYP